MDGNPLFRLLSSSPMKRSLALLACLAQASIAAPAKPNVVLILADDLGYGDISYNGAKGAVTPNIDKLASEGINFTDAHSSSSTCTPSRFALITGKYPFRQKGTGILPGDAEMIVKPGTTTLPSIFKQAGYATGAVGKWHLGLGDGRIDWNGEIKPSPNDIGFDESFIMAATGDRVPTVYIRNHRVENLDPADPISVSYTTQYPSEPDGKRDRASLKMDWSAGHNMAIVNGIGRIGFMKGGVAARWKDENMSQDFTREALGFIDHHKDQPFFLYFAIHNIHVPRVPNPMFVGKSTMGARGDSIIEADWQVGQVMAELDKLGIAENTLVIFSSDNGPVLDDGYKDGAVEKLGGHKPAGPFSGGKTSLLEGGNREPTIVRWKGHVKPGTSDALFGQFDLAASFASMLGVKLSDDALPDSLNVMPALLGESKTARHWIVEHNQYNDRLAYREGDWKLMEAAPKQPVQLFNLKDDIGEKHNFAAERPEVVETLMKKLEAIRQAEHTRPQS